MQDYQGMMTATRSHTICIIAEPMVAEAIVVFNAVEFNCDLGLPSIMFEGDSLQIVIAVKDTCPN
jgi:hypothetical protein